MGRPPSNGSPSFRFNHAEIAEMEGILQAHRIAMPERQVLVNLAEKFSKSEDRLGKIEVQMKQVWNWFQNRRYAIRAKAAKTPGTPNSPQMAPDNPSVVKVVPQVTQPHVAASSVNVRTFPQAPQHPPQHPTVPSASVRTFPQAPQHPPGFAAHSVGRVADNSQMEYEAKSARDGAWYDVSTFLSHRSLDTGDPEVYVRFAGFGAEEDEWVNVRKNVRQRSLPCEASECVAVLPSDLILCFQEGKEQALYFDAHVLDAQRRRHDVRGCRCRFLVRYDHDQSEEIVALRKICRRPETDYRLQQLHAVNESIVANQNKNGANSNNHTVSTLRVYPPAEVPPKQQKVEPTVALETPQKRQRLDSTVPPEGSQTQSKVAQPVIANAPQNPQTVQPAVPVPVVPTRTDEVAVELQKVQSVIPVPISEVSVDPHKLEQHNKPEAVGPAIPSLAEAPHVGETEPELAKLQKEPVVSGSSVEAPAELHDVQSAAPDQPHTSAQEIKTEEPMLSVSVDEPNVAEEAIEAKIQEPAVSVSSSVPNMSQEAIETEPVVLVSTNDDPNVLQEAKTDEPVVPVDPNVAHEAKTEESVMHVERDVVQEAKTDEPLGPVDPDVVQEAKTDESVVHVDRDVNQEIITDEPFVPIDPNVAQEAKTNELMVHVDPNVVQETKTEASMMSVEPNAAQESKTEEPVDPNMAQEAKAEEPVMSVGSNVVLEAKTDEAVVPVNENDPMVIEADDTEQAKVSEFVGNNEDKHANVAAYDESDDIFEDLDIIESMEEG